MASPNPSIPQPMDGLSSKAKSSQMGKDAKAVRGRRERPCDACRKRKSKCVTNDGQKNVCAACGVHGQECTYIEDPQPRKRRLEGDGKEVDLSKRRLVQPLGGVNSDADERLTFSRSVASESQSDVMGDRTPKIKREYESSRVVLDGHGLSKSPVDMSWSNPQHYKTHIGYTTELEPLLFDISQATGFLTLENRYQKPDERTAFLLLDPDLDRSGDRILGALSRIEETVGTLGATLMTTYRNHINRYFPIVDETFFQIYDGRQRNTLDPTLLAAVYLLAASTGNGLHSGISSPLDIDQLEEIAFRLFRTSLGKPTLSTIQAGILLIQSPNVDSNVLNTQIVGAAYELGLHLDCSTWKVSDDECNLRKRLAWAIYAQDKWCSLTHGRPSLISKAHWAVQGLGEDDYVLNLDETRDDVVADETKRGQDLFTQMVALTEILSTVLDTFYTLKAMQEVDLAGPNGTRLILERAKPVQIRLKEWFTHLPMSLKMDDSLSGKPSSTGKDSTSGTNFIPMLIPLGHLHLAYFATEITLHRCIIRSLNATESDTYLSHVCRSAAKTRLISAMDFVNRLRPGHLSSFWYFPSKVNFALIATFGSLLLATAPGQEEADFYRTRLAEYRWTLCVSSKSAEFLWFAVDSLDSSSLLLRSLPPKPPTAELYARLPPPAVAIEATPSAVTGLPPPGIAQGRPSPPQDGASPLLIGSSRHRRSSIPALLSQPVGRASVLEDAVASPSGLASPSTSISSGSSTYAAYADGFDTVGGVGGGGMGNGQHAGPEKDGRGWT